MSQWNMPPSRSPALTVVPALDTHGGLRSTPPPYAGSIATRSLGGLAGEAAEIHMGLRGCRSENAIRGRGRDHSTVADRCLYQGTPAPLSEPQFPSLQNQRARLSAPQRRSHLSRWPCLHGPRTRFGLCPAGSAQKTHSEALSPVSMPPGSAARTPQALGCARLLAPPSWGTL